MMNICLPCTLLSLTSTFVNVELVEISFIRSRRENCCVLQNLPSKING